MAGSCAGLIQKSVRCKDFRCPHEDFHEERVPIQVLDIGSLRDDLLIYIASEAFAATLSTDYQPPVCKSWPFEPNTHMRDYKYQ